MPELIAVFLSGHVFEEIAAHELLGDGRSALGEDGGAIGRIPLSHLREAPQQIQNPEFAHDAGKSEVVDSVVGEEVLVLGGENGAAKNGRDLPIPGDLAVFRSQLDERPAVYIVDVADSGKLKPAECLQVGQVGSIEIDVVNCACDQSGRDDCRAHQKANQATPPGQPAEPPRCVAETLGQVHRAAGGSCPVGIPTRER